MATLIAIGSVTNFSSYGQADADLIIVNEDERTSGNTFQWQNSGTANDGTVYAASDGGFWHMMFSGPANVKWYGAKGDGLADDSVAIQATLDDHASIFIPATEHFYRCSVFAKGQSIFGEKTVYKNGSTVPSRSNIRSSIEGDYALHLGVHDNWDYVPINDIWISGNSVSNGVQFDNKGIADSYSGRWVLNSVTFQNCTIAINKPTGNIGNTFNSCCFTGGEYHYRAINAEDMHSGCDTFNSCQFDSSSKASIYMDQGYIPHGQHTFSECIFEGNAGFVFFIKNYGWISVVPLTINNAWLESNATYTTVNIDGIDYTPVEYYINSASEVIFNGCDVQTLYTRNSLIQLNNCHVGGEFDIDSASMVVANGGVGGGTKLGVRYNTPFSAAGGIGPDQAGFIRMLPRTKTSYRMSDNVLAAEGFNDVLVPNGVFNANNFTFVGAYWASATRVKDGTCSNSCAEFTVPAGQGFVHYSTIFNVPGDGNKYLVWMVDIKRISGDAPNVSIGNWVQITKTISVDVALNKWINVSGAGIVGGIFGNANVGFLISNPGTADLTVRIGGISFLVLDTWADAVEALSSGEMFVKNSTPAEVGGYQSPALESSTVDWYIGDRSVNINPTVGQPVGWTCTATGTPGTWVDDVNL